MTTFEPKWVVHPGELLREELRERGIKQAELCRRIGWTEKHLSKVCTGKVPISIPLALALEAELGTNARLWLNLQLAYDLGCARGYPYLT